MEKKRIYDRNLQNKCAELEQQVSHLQMENKTLKDQLQQEKDSNRRNMVSFCSNVSFWANMLEKIQLSVQDAVNISIGMGLSQVRIIRLYCISTCKISICNARFLQVPVFVQGVDYDDKAKRIVEELRKNMQYGDICKMLLGTEEIQDIASTVSGVDAAFFKAISDSFSDETVDSWFLHK